MQTFRRSLCLVCLTGISQFAVGLNTTANAQLVDVTARAAEGTETSTTDDAAKVEAAPEVNGSESSDQSADTASSGPQIWATRSMEMRFGLTFAAGDNYCERLHATLPFPMVWPEQNVELIAFEKPEFATYQVRQHEGAGEIVIDLSRMSPNDVFDVYAVVKVSKSFIKAPENPEELVFASRPSRNKQLAPYLGDSPYIETKIRQIRNVAVEIRDSKPANAWAHVEQIYDWVRNNIQYVNGDIKTTSQALKDKTGDCEEMTSIFIAICRASDIPARCVWVPDHCYPEFYLEDKDGNGYWFPCQVAGDRQFGEMNEYRPIRQKGDRFKTPETKKKFVRYLAETFSCDLKGSTGPTPPSITPILDLGPLESELGKDSTRGNAGLSLSDEEEAESDQVVAPEEDTADTEE